MKAIDNLKRHIKELHSDNVCENLKNYFPEIKGTQQNY